MLARGTRRRPSPRAAARVPGGPGRPDRSPARPASL